MTTAAANAGAVAGSGSGLDSFSTLIGVDDLAAHLGAPNWVIVDCRFTLGDPRVGEAAYGKSRLPSARYAHLERDLSGPRRAGSGRNPLPEPQHFARTLATWGITAQTQVVVYDDSFGSIACRLWWLLRAFGHQNVALLDGGWPVWKRKKAPIDETPLDQPPPFGNPVAAPPPPTFNDALLADATRIEAIRRDPTWALIDARPDDRYSGERETIDPVGGHIPGSRNWMFEDNLAMDGRFLAADELRDNFATLLGDIAPTHVVHTCGSGITACHNVLAMEHAGLTGSRLYAGSWSEWITDPARPVATGND